MTKPIVTQQAKLDQLKNEKLEAEVFNHKIRMQKFEIALLFLYSQAHKTPENLARLQGMEEEVNGIELIDTDSIQKEIEKLIKDN